MAIKVTIGEASGAVILFFLWLAAGLELLYLWEPLSWIYFFVSFVIYLVYMAVGQDHQDFRGARTLEDVRANRLARMLLDRPPEERRYTKGRVSLTILKGGSVKLTPWRTVIFLGVIAAWFALFILWLALAPQGNEGINLQLIFAGVLALLIVINFLEVMWRRADTPKSNLPSAPN